jgi:hypothetical protein
VADITVLIHADHDWFREQFAKLDDLRAQTLMAQHRTTKGLSIVDRDPEGYVEDLENAPPAKPADHSLGIGSLKGK